MHSNFVRTTPPKTPLPQPSLRAGVVVADREGFEPSPCAAETPDFTRGEHLADTQSSPKSSPSAGIDCPELAIVVNEWAFLSPALRLAISSIVESSKAERGDDET